MKTSDVSAMIDRRVSEVLFYIWDPIGINLNVSCRDEYNDYAPIVTAYLLSNTSEVDLDSLLLYIMENEIGIKLVKNQRRKHQHQQAIQALINWKNYFLDKFPSETQSAPKFPFNENYESQLNWSRSQSLIREY